MCLQNQDIICSSDQCLEFMYIQSDKIFVSLSLGVFYFLVMETFLVIYLMFALELNLYCMVWGIMCLFNINLSESTDPPVTK